MIVMVYIKGSTKRTISVLIIIIVILIAGVGVWLNQLPISLDRSNFVDYDTTQVSESAVKNACKIYKDMVF